MARCLANDPDLILMDEPLGALDALTREKMQGLVLKLWQKTGKTVILITHSVEEALLLGARLIVMAPRPGRVLRDERLPFAAAGVAADLHKIKKRPDFIAKREEILVLLWGWRRRSWARERRHDRPWDLCGAVSWAVACGAAPGHDLWRCRGGQAFADRIGAFGPCAVPDLGGLYRIAAGAPACAGGFTGETRFAYATDKGTGGACRLGQARPAP